MMSNNYHVMATLSNAPEMFTDKRYHLLSEFSLKDWGRPELFLKKETFPDVGAIEYVDFGKYLSSIRLCHSETELGLVVVRAEYYVVLEALRQPLYGNGAYVTEQPGIGKYQTMSGVSLSLNLTLALFLQGKHPSWCNLLVYFLGQ